MLAPALRSMKIAGASAARPVVAAAMRGVTSPHGSHASPTSATALAAAVRSTLSCHGLKRSACVVPPAVQVRGFSSPAGTEIDQLPDALQRMLSLDNASQVLPAAAAAFFGFCYLVSSALHHAIAPHALLLAAKPNSSNSRFSHLLPLRGNLPSYFPLPYFPCCSTPRWKRTDTRCERPWRSFSAIQETRAPPRSRLPSSPSASST